MLYDLTPQTTNFRERKREKIYFLKPISSIALLGHNEIWREQEYHEELMTRSLEKKKVKHKVT